MKKVDKDRLETLFKSAYWGNREEAARQGYKLDKLIYDKEWSVRVEVARQGYGLDILINDMYYGVRVEVAKQGYGLDKLINDKSKFVRATVAKQGYGLNKLINDKERYVRATVADQGYGLDKLVSDKDQNVREAVVMYLKDNDYSSINNWADKNPDKIYNSTNTIIDDIKNFIIKVDNSCKFKIALPCDNIDDLFNTDSDNSDNSDELFIFAINTKQPIIRIQQISKNEFKFIVNIVTDTGDNFNVITSITSIGQLNTKVKETVEALRNYSTFSIYADDLESCV